MLRLQGLIFTTLLGFADVLLALELLLIVVCYYSYKQYDYVVYG